MGVSNRQRRAAKQRKRAKARSQRPRTGGEPIADGPSFEAGDPFAHLDDRAAARNLVAMLAGELQASPDQARRLAGTVAGEWQRIDGHILVDTIREWLGHLISSVVGDNWTPSDLVEIVRRRGHDEQFPMLAALLVAETSRHDDDHVSPQWCEDLDRLPPPVEPVLRSTRELEIAFGLAGVLIRLPKVEPTIPSPGTRWHVGDTAGSASSSKHLTRVRALLAKAESTESPEEAEALSAKAQDLISRYALDRLLNVPASAESSAVVARRIWIDVPYVRPKASLVNAIAGANRCRAVMSESLGFISVIGEPADLDAIELMTASLLVQAQAAMVAHGSQTDGVGTSRTRSFRQSFLVAYAARIGERLQAASDEAAEETGEAKALVPILRRHAEQVDAACDEMFPNLVRGRTTSISNGQGWAAGRAAADLASLDAHKNVTARS